MIDSNDRRLVFAAILMLSGTASSHAAIAWNEGAQGDLSNDRLAPTVLTLEPGSNSISGFTGNSGQGVDRDYVTFSVPDGSTLSALRILGTTTISGGSSFIALQAGPQITASPEGAGAASLLGYTHYSLDNVGINLLSFLAPTLPGGLPAGTYSAWVQETGGPVNYDFDFVLTPVPLPAAAWLMISGLLGLAAVRKRRV